MNDGVIKSKWLPRGVYENRFTLYEALATELKHYVWKNLYTASDLTSEMIESGMMKERSANLNLVYIRKLTPHGLTSASIWNRMLEKEITVVDLWKLTLYGLSHVNLYNSTPITMHKTRYRGNVENGFQLYFTKENLKENMEKYFQPYRGNPSELWLFREKSQNQEFLKKYQPIIEFRTTDDNRTEWQWRFKHFGWARRMRLWLSVSKKLAALLPLEEMVSLSNGRIEKSFWADDSSKIIIIFYSSRDETKWLPFPEEDEKRLIFVHSGIHETSDVRGIENDVNDAIIIRPAPPSVAMALKNEWGECDFWSGFFGHSTSSHGSDRMRDHIGSGIRIE